MAIFITEQIPEQGFELITKQIGAILLEEIENQNLLSYSNMDLGVFIERTIPIDKSEDVVINISLNSINYDEHNEFEVHGAHSFNIDFDVFGQDSIEQNADTDVRIKIQKVVGWARYILSSPKLKTLGFEPGLISGTYVQSVNFDDTYGKEDGAMNRFCRMVFSVRAFEVQNPDESSDFALNDTGIKIDSTDKGYKLTFNT